MSKKVYIICHRDVIENRNDGKTVIVKTIPDKVFASKESAYFYANRRKDGEVSEIYELDLEY